MVIPVMVENIGKDQVSINSKSLTNNILSLYVAYGGGCKTHELNLYVLGVTFILGIISCRIHQTTEYTEFTERKSRLKNK
jgi:hypothetical protein